MRTVAEDACASSAVASSVTTPCGVEQGPFAPTRVVVAGS